MTWKSYGLALAVPFLLGGAVKADQVIMKDGTVYKGKIQIDTDKAVLIGNPPFDPNAYLLESKDIEKIVYEEYKPNPPAERKRGLTAEVRVGPRVYQSDQLELNPSGALYLGIGFRVHPLIELNGGFEWMPGLQAKDAFEVSNGTTTRRYEDFLQYNFGFSVRLYPFYQKKWKTEPYLFSGVQWSRLSAKSSGDSLRGTGWQVGAGVLRPLTQHVFLEGRFSYDAIDYDTIHFLGRKSGISPHVKEGAYSLQGGISYRL